MAWGFQNTGITGSNRWMYLRETIPAEDQYRGVLWTPLYTAPPQQNEFNPDWDAMAVMVEEQQRMAKRIEELKERLLQVELEPKDKIGSPCKEFWGWLPKAYRDGDKGNEPKFTKYHMEVAYLAGKQSQPKHEPVAFFYLDADGEERFAHPEGYYPSYAKPLYAAPPQRPWQCLTDEEIHSAEGYEEDRKLYRFARAIEQALKEKNA